MILGRGIYKRIPNKVISDSKKPGPQNGRAFFMLKNNNHAISTSRFYNTHYNSGNRKK
jgi:hypothetical protein